MRQGLFAGVFACVVAVGLGCGGNLTQSEARQRVTAQSCDWYQNCGDIGAGEQFADRDQCEVSVESFWNTQWPLASCDNKIPPAALETCLQSIENTVCGNGLDFLNTVLNKCGQSQVCKG